MEQLSRANLNLLSKPFTPTTKEDAIETLLAMLSVARQANARKPEFDLYTPFLMPYELKHIKTAIERLSLKPRAEGETAFPALATVLEGVRAVVRECRPSEPTSGERWASHVEEFWKNPPAPLDDELQARVDALNEKYDLKKPKEIETVNSDLVCPKCQFAHPVSVNLRNWNSKEIYDYAVLVEQLEVIAARNRSMSNLPLGDVVDEVTA